MYDSFLVYYGNIQVVSEMIGKFLTSCLEKGRLRHNCKSFYVVIEENRCCLFQILKKFNLFKKHCTLSVGNVSNPIINIQSH